MYVCVHTYNMEGTKLSEISQRKTNTVWFHLSVESEKTNQLSKQASRNRPLYTENKLMVAGGEGGEGMDTMGEGEWEVQASSY